MLGKDFPVQDLTLGFAIKIYLLKVAAWFFSVVWTSKQKPLSVLLFGSFKFAYLNKTYSFETLGHVLPHLTVTFVNCLQQKS